MPSTYSSLLRLELMATGEKSATWGDITNTNLGTLLEKSIAGLASVNVTAGNVTLTALNGTDDESRCAIIAVTGTPGVSRNVVAPSSAKLYAVLNGSNAAIVFKGAATSGVTLAAGEEAWLAWNGLDFALIGVPQSSPSFAGQIFGPAGTVSLPGYTFTGDGNNGWWSPAADTQAWSLAGAEAMRLNSAGLGIGVTPSTALHVKGPNATVARVETALARGAGQVTLGLADASGTKGYFGYGSADDRLQIYQGLAERMEFYTSGALRMTLSATAANLGIGMLPVAGSGLAITVPGSQIANFLSSDSGAVNSGITFGSPGSNYLSAGVAGLAQSGSTGALILQYVTGAALVEGARLDVSGNFGIGISPTFRLDVAESSAGNAVARMSNLGTGASAHASVRVESAAAGGDAYTYYIRTGTYDWYTGLDATDNYYKIGTGSAVGTGNALVVTPSSIGVGVVPTSNIDVSVAGTTIRQRLRAGAGFASILSICGNNTTAEVTSFDLQMDSAGAVDVVNRNNSRMSFYTNASERLRLNSDGSFYGTALHNVGTPTGTATQYIASGTYTPTQPGSSSNVASTTPGKAQWMRVGNVVTVSGSVVVDPTSANTATFFQLSLPIASDLTATTDLAGTASFMDASDVPTSVRILGDTSGNAAQFNTRSTADTASNTWYYTYTYEVK